jgi:predicted transcriptional regulator
MHLAPNTQPRATVTARIAPAHLEQLRQIARQEDRSLSTELRRAVVEHVDRYEASRPSSEVE